MVGGELDGKVGWFPEAYAEPVSTPSMAPAKPPAPVAASSATTVSSSAETNNYVALFAYLSEEPGDLQFEAGEQIEVIKKESEWWTGKIGDRTGVFPYNYVEAAAAAPEEKTVIPEPKVEENLAASVPDTGPPSDGGAGSSSESDSEGKSGKKPELATVIAPYTASGKEQLNLQKGQMILVRKKTETGWCKEKFKLLERAPKAVRDKLVGFLLPMSN